MEHLILDFIKNFASLIIMVAPYFVAGIVFGAFLESRVKFDFIYRYIGQGKRSILYASLLGAILPGCACATIPMAEGLRRRGAKIGTVGAFMLTSPLLAPQTIFLTYGLLGLKFTVARVIFSLIGGIGIGLILYKLNKTSNVVMPDDDIKSQASDCHNDDASCHPKNGNKLPTFLNSCWSITKKLSFYFFIGMAIASVLTTLVPMELIPGTLGKFPWLAYFLATFIGIPVYICEGEEIPITFSLLALGLGNGPSFTFMLGAVGTCIPTILFAKQLLGKKALIIYAGFWFVFAPLVGLIFSIF